MLKALKKKYQLKVQLPRQGPKRSLGRLQNDTSWILESGKLYRGDGLVKNCPLFMPLKEDPEVWTDTLFALFSLEHK